MKADVMFFDTEIHGETGKVLDIGAIRSSGVRLHTKSLPAFATFIRGSRFFCGHNILAHDLKYVGNLIQDACPGYIPIDTLCLSPLLFPTKPYHKLLKNDKLQVDELNNPVNDSMKARDLLNDEIAAWNGLAPDRQEIYYQLLRHTTEFGGFFDYIKYVSTAKHSFLGRILNTQPDWPRLILKEFEGKLCSHADFGILAKLYPIEMAYCLAVIGADDVFSITPAWVIRNYPQVST